MAKRLVLLGGVALLAVLLGFVTLTPLQAVGMVREWGVVWVAAALLGLGVMTVREARRLTRSAWADRARRVWPAGLLVAGAAVFLQFQEPHALKIVADEIVLSSTAKQIHEHREGSMVLRAYEYGGNFVPLNTRVDKRPLLFPVLLAAVHDLTGYRFENVFVLNGLLSVAMLVLLFVLGRRLAGTLGGVAAVVWICAVPLVTQNVVGAGFEILNLVMILLVVWLGLRYAEKPDDADRLGQLLFAAVLLAQVRYESGLFILPVGAVVLYGWWRRRAPLLSPAVYLTPLLLLPVPWQQNVFKLSELSWQLQDIEGATTPFALAYFYDNVGHALNFFATLDGSQPNAWLLAGLGLLALGFATMLIYRRHREAFANAPGEAAFMIMLLGLTAHAGMMLCYFWGHWDDPVIRRLSLPTHLLLVLALLYVWGATPSLARRTGWLMGLATVQLVGWSMPAMARQEYNAENFAARTADWLQSFARGATDAGQRIFVIDPAADLMWFLHNQSAMSPYMVARRVEEFAYHFERQTFDEVWIVQRIEVNLATGERFPALDHDMAGGLALEKIAERAFAPYYVIRLSRVVGVNREALLKWGEMRVKYDDAAPARAITPIMIDPDGIDAWLRNLP